MASGAPIDLAPIGFVSSTLTELGEAPRQPDEGAPQATIVVDERFADALKARLTVAGLEAIDGTPVLDIKPVLSDAVGDR